MKNDAEMLRIAYKALDDKFAEDIIALDIREISIMSDYFMIASGGNVNQIKAMADEVQDKLFKYGLKFNSIEGYGTSSWILIDFNDIIVHLFLKDERDFYRLEKVWGDAKIIEPDKLAL